MHAILKFKFQLELYYSQVESCIYISDEFDSLTKLKGALFCEVAKILIEEDLTKDQIVERLNYKHTLENIYYVLLKLQDGGFVFDYVQKIPDFINKICCERGLNTEFSYQQILSSPLHVISKIKLVSNKDFEKVLNSYFLKTCKDIDQSKIVIVLVDDYLDPDFKHLCDELAVQKKLIFPLKLGASDSWAGPILKYDAACHECLLERITANVSGTLLVRSSKKTQSIKLKQDPVVSSIVEGSLVWGALEVFNLVTAFNETLLNPILTTFDFFSYKKEKHALVKVTNCPRCSIKKSEDVSKKITLKSQKKIYSKDGGCRVVSPKETVKRLEKLVSPILGIVQKITKVEGLDDPIHVYQATYPSKLSLSCTLENLKVTQLPAAGKGKSKMQAKASCLCEAIERYCLTHNIREGEIKARYKDLQEDAIHPDLLQNYSKRQYNERDIANRSLIKFVHVTEPFDEEREISWFKVWSLTQQKYKWVPSSYCHSTSNLEEKEIVKAHSNGCAAGNTLEEAILQGFFELVERDQCALWWYSMFQVPEIDLDSSFDPYVQELKKSYLAQNREIRVLDITLDLGIPTFIAVSTANGSHLLIGLGCHLDASIALSRALSELNQGLTSDKSCFELKEDISYLYPKPNTPKKQLSDFKTQHADDIAKDILVCQKKIEERGLEMLALDLSHPEIDLKVAQVIVPGLRHFWPRFAPGRLYDVPYKMGLVPKKLSEEDLNPVPMVF